MQPSRKPVAGEVSRLTEQQSDSRTRNSAESENMRLMREMGATRFDPQPPDQYLYFLHDKTAPPLQRLLAWVQSKTIQLGHRSPICVNEQGYPLKLDHIAADFGWSLTHARQVWADAEGKGLVRKDDQERLWICGNVPIPSDPKPAGEDEEKNCTVFFPSYITEQIQQLNEKQQARLHSDYLAYHKWKKRFNADVRLLERSIEVEREVMLFSRYGIKLRRENKKERGHSPQEFIHLSLTKVPEEFVQLFENSVQTDSETLYEPEIESVQNPQPICIERRDIEREDIYSSSSLSEQPATTTNLHQILTEELNASLNGHGALTGKQSSEVEAAISALPEPELAARSFVTEYLPPRLPKISHAGAIPALARGEFTRLWPGILKLKLQSFAAVSASADRDVRQRDDDAAQASYEDWVNHEYLKQVEDLTADDVAKLRKVAEKQLKAGKRYERLSPQQREVEIDLYVRAEITKGLPSFAEWKRRR